MGLTLGLPHEPVSTRLRVAPLELWAVVHTSRIFVSCKLALHQLGTQASLAGLHARCRVLTPSKSQPWTRSWVSEQTFSDLLPWERPRLPWTRHSRCESSVSF